MIFDMTHFMGDDPLEFAAVKYLKDPCGDRYGSVGRVTAGGKGVGGFIVYHIHLGFGYAGPGCQ